MLHLSTRWGFASIRKWALSSIKPPTPHDRLLLARTYSVDDWVVPALSALCERTTPLTLSEARQMDIEDVVLVSTVREDIREHALRIDATEIPRRVEAVQAGKLTIHEDIVIPLGGRKSVMVRPEQSPFQRHTVANRAVSATTIVAASPNMHQKQAAYESDGGRLVSSIPVRSDFGR